jgi:hypothetical protein
MGFGTMTTFDSLAASNATILTFGEANAFDAIEAALTVHNRILQEQVADLVEVTNERQRVYGTNASIRGEKVDQFGTVDAQKVTAGQTVYFPLDKTQYSVQWTRDALEIYTAAEVAAQTTAIMDGDVADLQLELKRAIFVPTNRTVIDRFVDHTALYVKAFLNADGTDIPIGPAAQAFDGATHTHYLADGTTDTDTIKDLVNTVVEHYSRGAAIIYINRAQEGMMRGFTDFVPYLDARLLASDSVTRARSGTLDEIQLYNRSIGVIHGAEVWIKPWIPAGYMYCWIVGAPKPLVMRQRRPGLRLNFDNEMYPLRARNMEREFGFGVWNRTNGAVLYTGGNTYTAPTLI